MYQPTVLTRHLIGTVLFTFLYMLLASVLLVGCSSDDSDSDTAPPVSENPAPEQSLPTGPQQPGAEIEQLVFDDFESGWGHFIDGGEDAMLSKERSHSGEFSIRLQDDSDSASSITLRNAIDITKFKQLTVDFWFYSESLQNGHEFSLHYFDGKQWRMLERFVKGGNFGNKVFTHYSITIDSNEYRFPNNMRIKFACKTLNDTNAIYLDDIVIAASIKNPPDDNNEPPAPITPPSPPSPPEPPEGLDDFDHAGLDTGCRACHNDVRATGKSQSHIPSSDTCEDCHNPDNGWRADIGRDGSFDHTGITVDCFGCHNGEIATGKSSTHIPSSNVCEDCHHPDNGWTLTVVGEFDHTGITSGCFGCHNGEIATGKSSAHIPSSDDCENCHSPGAGWESITGFDHTGITSGCVSCHNGETATGKSEFHIPSSDNCETCHSPDNGWAVVVQPGFDHAGVVSSCVSCHNGTTATGKSSTHIPSSDVCEDCHTPGSGWKVDGGFDHTGITSGCATCHNGTTATGKSETHIPSDDNCETCHSPDSGWQVRVAADFNHAGITSSCAACHNGTIASGKSENHIESSDVCEDCHTPGGSWASERFDHTGITSGCSDCHNGTTATGKGPSHIDSSDNCETCHSPDGGWQVKVAADFDHAGITSSCVACHNGTIAGGKPANHIPSGNACEDCHTPGGGWDNVSFSQDGNLDTQAYSGNSN